MTSNNNINSKDSSMNEASIHFIPKNLFFVEKVDSFWKTQPQLTREYPDKIYSLLYRTGLNIHLNRKYFKWDVEDKLHFLDYTVRSYSQSYGNILHLPKDFGIESFDVRLLIAENLWDKDVRENVITSLNEFERFIYKNLNSEEGFRQKNYLDEIRSTLALENFYKSKSITANDNKYHILFVLYSLIYPEYIMSEANRYELLASVYRQFYEYKIFLPTIDKNILNEMIQIINDYADHHNLNAESINEILKLNSLFEEGYTFFNDAEESLFFRIISIQEQWGHYHFDSDIPFHLKLI